MEIRLKEREMEIHRSPMEKILKEMENDTIITNPKDPVKTFFRKIRYKLACMGDIIKRIFHRR